MNIDKRFKLILGLGLIILVMGLVTVLILARGKGESNQKSLEANKPRPTDEPMSEANASPMPTPDLEKVKNKKDLNVLVLGYGGAGHEGGFLTDVVMLIHVDEAAKKLALITLPRDLWLSVPAIGINNPRKLNSYFILKTTVPTNYPREKLKREEAFGGAFSTAEAVKTITGFEPDYFIGIDFNSYKAAIDSLKGIEVNVPETFSDNFYPIKGRELELCGKTPEEVTELSHKLNGFELEKQFPCRYEQLHFEKGVTHMDGETALKFVRSRHSSSDFARSMRQQAVLVAIREKLLTQGALKDTSAFFKRLIGFVNTNFDLEAVKVVTGNLPDIGEYKVVRINLSTENVLVTGTASTGAFILTPKDGLDNFAGVKNFIQGKLTGTD
jgi:LCP family protein required for cell wall assembly